MATVALCPELNKILNKEIKNGNKLLRKPYLSEWPDKKTVWAELKNNFTIDIANLPENIEYTICNDIHYGWYADLYCIEHKHVLAAGELK